MAGLERGGSLSSSLAVGIGDEGDVQTGELGELLGNGSERERRLRAVALGAAEVAHEDDLGVVVNEVLDGGDGGLDARGIAHDAIGHRHVEVHAHEDALAVDIDVADGLLGESHVHSFTFENKKGAAAAL